MERTNLFMNEEEVSFFQISLLIPTNILVEVTEFTGFQRREK
jgi:hypothetical protein